MSSPLPPLPRIPNPLRLLLLLLRISSSAGNKALFRRGLLPHHQLHPSRLAPYFGTDWFGKGYKWEKGSKGRMCKKGTGVFDGMNERQTQDDLKNHAKKK